MTKGESTKTRDQIRWSGRVGGSCSTSGTRRGLLVSNPVKGLDYDYEKRIISVVICDTGLFWS